jgi:hypothetical protein
MDSLKKCGSQLFRLDMDKVGSNTFGSGTGGCGTETETEGYGTETESRLQRGSSAPTLNINTCRAVWASSLTRLRKF